MKRFGVQIAAGAVTILLGALAAAQAQRGGFTGSGQSTWTTSSENSLDNLDAPVGTIDASFQSDNAGQPPFGLTEIEPGEVNNAFSQNNGFPQDHAGTTASMLTATAYGDNQGVVEQVSHDELADSNPPSFTMGMPEISAPSEATSAAELAYELSPAADASTSPTLSPSTEGRQASAPTASPEPGAVDEQIAPVQAPSSLSLTALPPSFGADNSMESADPIASEPSAAPSQGTLRGFSLPPGNGTNEALTSNPPAVREATPQGNAAMDIQMPALDMSFGQPEAFADNTPGNPTVSSGPEPGNELRGSASSLPQLPMPGAGPSADPRTTSPPLPENNQAFAQQASQPSFARDLPPSDSPYGTTQYSGPSAGQRTQAPASLAGYPERSPQPFGGTQSAPPQPRETISTPGDRRLDGVQSPSIVIQKRAPAQVKVGKPASFSIQVQNVGSVEALDVQVHDQVPQGMQLVDASPRPQTNDRQGRLVWALGSLEPGGERTVTMQLIPLEEGELGSVARVTFEAAASVRTISTRPQLKVVQRGPAQVLIGQQAEIEIEISNPGTGVASGIIIQEDVPEQFEHPYGSQLDKPIGDLQPGETRREVLRLRAVAAGQVTNVLRVIGDDDVQAAHQIDLEVVAPHIRAELAGPSRRFLERQAKYQIQFANVGTATANNVQFVAQLDRGFKFVSAENKGQYDPTQHAVYWSMAQLQAGQSGTSEMTLLPVEEGDQVIRLETRSDLTQPSIHEAQVAVDSLAELTFEIADTADPIEQGGETTYEIRVRNSGSRNDSNVKLNVQLPAGFKLLGSDQDAQSDGRGNVYFAPTNQLAAGEELVYLIRVQGVLAGRHLVKAIVSSDQSDVPVTKEESTMVYSDR